MENRKMIVVVEETEAARTALQWAVKNIFRNGDFITLLYVFPSLKSKKKKKQNQQRVLRLKGFQLALSFKDLCDRIPEVKVEIIVSEGDQGERIVSLVKEINASALILGIHEQSFLHKTTITEDCINRTNCRVLAVKQRDINTTETSDFSQIEIRNFRVPEHRTLFRALPSSFGTIWKSSCRRKRSA